MVENVAGNGDNSRGLRIKLENYLKLAGIVILAEPKAAVSVNIVDSCTFTAPSTPAAHEASITSIQTDGQ
jgi:hypothetical protein